jgi:hypothetical protein
MLNETVDADEFEKTIGAVNHLSEDELFWMIDCMF